MSSTFDTAPCTEHIARLDARIQELESRLAEQDENLLKTLWEKQFFVDLFEKNHAVQLIIDPVTGRILDANTAACNFYGYRHEQMIAMRIWDINTLGEEEARARMRDARQSATPRFTFPHRLSSGEVRQVHVYSGPVEANGRVVLYSIIHDVTEHQKLERAFRSSEEKFRLAFHFCPDALAIHKLPGHEIVEANDALARMTGIPHDQLLGRTFVELNIWADLSQRELFVKEFYSRGVVRDFPAKFHRRDGTHIDVRVTSELNSNMDGRSIFTSIRYQDPRHRP